MCLKINPDLSGDGANTLIQTIRWTLFGNRGKHMTNEGFLYSSPECVSPIRRPQKN